MNPPPDTPEKASSAPVEAKKTPPKPKKAKKPVAKKKSAPKKAAVSKSDEVRKLAKELQAKGEKVRPVTIVNALKARGITVAAPQVSMVLKKMGLKRRKRRSSAGTSAARPGVKKASKSQLSVDDLLKAKKMAQEFGGAENLVNAISALVELQ